MMRKKTMDELGRLEAHQYQGVLPVIVVLDEVRSMSNVGSVFRSADAFAIEGIYLCGLTPTPPHRDIHKTALGATETVPWKHSATTVDALNQLKSEGYTLLAIEQVHDSISLENYVPDKNNKTALVFGHEVFGVSEEALALCDATLEIPQWGTKHSLNIAVSTGIVLWKFAESYLHKS